jgi:hypothetical protein
VLEKRRMLGSTLTDLTVMVSWGSPTAAWIDLLHETWKVLVSCFSTAANSARSITTRPRAAVASVRPSVSRMARMMHFFLNGPSWEAWEVPVGAWGSA